MGFEDEHNRVQRLCAGIPASLGQPAGAWNKSAVVYDNAIYPSALTTIHVVVCRYTKPGQKIWDLSFAHRGSPLLGVVALAEGRRFMGVVPKKELRTTMELLMRDAEFICGPCDVLYQKGAWDSKDLGDNTDNPHYVPVHKRLLAYCLSVAASRNKAPLRSEWLMSYQIPFAYIKELSYDKDFEVKASEIEGCDGHGLFTKVAHKKGAHLLDFYGYWAPKAYIRVIHDNGSGAYAFELPFTCPKSMVELL